MKVQQVLESKMLATEMGLKCYQFKSEKLRLNEKVLP